MVSVVIVLCDYHVHVLTMSGYSTTYRCQILKLLSNLSYFTATEIKVRATYQRFLPLVRSLDQIGAFQWSYCGQKLDYQGETHLSDPGIIDHLTC